MTETLKIIIPMAGLGARLRPHTWNKPKPLIPLAGRTLLDYCLDTFKSIPLTRQVEYVFIIGPNGEQIRDYMAIHYPQTPTHYVVQADMRGQSDAILLAREHLNGPAIVAFADTLVDTDFTPLSIEKTDAIVWVKPVEDPRRFGVAEVGSEGFVKRLIEKPQDMKNNLAMVGVYYFKECQQLCDAIEEQIKKNVSLRGEFYLADAVNILLEKGLKMRAQPIEIWLDAGTPESLLSTNQYLLEHGHDNLADYPSRPGVSILPPVFIHPSVEIISSVVGPNVTIGANCHIESCVLRNSIIADETDIRCVVAEGSLLGSNIHVSGKLAHLNLGDQSVLEL